MIKFVDKGQDRSADNIQRLTVATKKLADAFNATYVDNGGSFLIKRVSKARGKSSSTRYSASRAMVDDWKWFDIPPISEGGYSHSEFREPLIHYYSALSDYLRILFKINKVTFHPFSKMYVSGRGKREFSSANKFLRGTPESKILDKIPKWLDDGGLWPHAYRPPYIFNTDLRLLFKKIREGIPLISSDIPETTFFSANEMKLFRLTNDFIETLTDKVNKGQASNLELFEEMKSRTAVPITFSPLVGHVDHKPYGVKPKGTFKFFDEDKARKRLRRLADNLSQQLIDSGDRDKILKEFEGITMRMLTASGMTVASSGSVPEVNMCAKRIQAVLSGFWYQKPERLYRYNEVMRDYLEELGFDPNLLFCSNVDNRVQGALKSRDITTGTSLGEKEQDPDVIKYATEESGHHLDQRIGYLSGPVLEEGAAKVRAMFKADGTTNAAARPGDTCLKQGLARLKCVAKAPLDILHTCTEFLKSNGIDYTKITDDQVNQIFKSMDVSRFDNAVNVDLLEMSHSDFVVPFLENLGVDTELYSFIRTRSASLYTDWCGMHLLMVHFLQKLNSGEGNTSEQSKIAMACQVVPDYLCSQGFSEDEIDTLMNVGYVKDFFLGDFGDDFTNGDLDLSRGFEPFASYLEERGIEVTTEPTYSHLAHFINIQDQVVHPSILKLLWSILYVEREKTDSTVVELAVYSRLTMLQKHPWFSDFFPLYSFAFSIRTGRTLRKDWLAYSQSDEFKERVSIAVRKSSTNAQALLDLVNWFNNGDWSNVDEGEHRQIAVIRDTVDGLLASGQAHQLNFGTLWQTDGDKFEFRKDENKGEEWERLLAILVKQDQLSEEQLKFLTRLRNVSSYEDILEIQLQWFVAMMHTGNRFTSIPPNAFLPDVSSLMRKLQVD